MKERPIIFSGPMVRAILEGRKTQTRRAVSAKLNRTTHLVDCGGNPFCIHTWPAKRLGVCCFDCNQELLGRCPYGQPGDRLWVRETWGITVGETIMPIIPKSLPDNGRVYYRVDEEPGSEHWGSWKPSIHMPRWASRLTLEVVNVRVERLQDISTEDAMAEGIYLHEKGFYTADLNFKNSGASAVEAFKGLWQSINGAGSWDQNHWVWVVEFRQMEESQ